MKHFKIGSKIKEILTNDSEVIKYIKNKVFPIVANNGTDIPFVIYRRFNYEPQSNKDYKGESAEFEVRVVANKYEDSVKIADAVGDALNDYKDNDVEQIRLITSNEDYLDEVFVQTSNFYIELK